eukprot:12678213-Prorocentrum_lima.AAC.1
MGGDDAYPTGTQLQVNYHAPGLRSKSATRPIGQGGADPDLRAMLPIVCGTVVDSVSTDDGDAGGAPASL